MTDSDSAKRYDVTAPILEHRQVAQDHYWMKLSCAPVAAASRPGQFVHVQIRQDTSPLLRRPLTIYRHDEENIELLYQVIGAGTELLSHAQPGSSVNILGPLGNQFWVPDDTETALVVGGGVGMASLMLLAEELTQSVFRPIVLLGAQCASRLVALDDLQSLGVEVHVATDDGSQGYHGFVTELADQELKKGLPNPVVYGCGPTPMMRALSDVTARHHVPTQLALESYMGCALGVCLGCVVRIRDSKGEPQQLRVCTEGPVFEAERIVW